MTVNIIAILRGVKPDEVIPIADAILQTGIDTIEVPLNSPDPLESIKKLATEYSDTATIGAGTVLKETEVQQVHEAGGTLIVSPNCNPKVISKTKALAMQSWPGVMTPSECFEALEYGADGLKLFPAELIGLKGFKAMKAVLPDSVKAYAVGGAGPENFQDWFAAGINGFGIGSALYKPGMTVSEVKGKASALVKAYKEAQDQ